MRFPLNMNACHISCFGQPLKSKLTMMRLGLCQNVPNAQIDTYKLGTIGRIVLIKQRIICIIGRVIRINMAYLFEGPYVFVNPTCFHHVRAPALAGEPFH
jgi:hypothetical protein